ncbi:MAG: tetratricopeptide repeat protein [Acidobacteria bacterium]|nr:MAG: tetratricopeptide repeat protein [Acidobacteriota bacterium]
MSGGGRVLVMGVVLLGACAEAQPPAGDAPGSAVSRTAASLPEGAEAVSLGGEPLFPPELAPEVLAEREEKLAAAWADYQAHRDDADAIIWLGRRTAYLGLYRDAIAIFSEGIDKHPEDARMYRHRGHRHISVRELERAVSDLEKAAQLIAGTEDQVEPDGLPNARNIPTSTLQSNIWYHLGLAYYLQGDLDNALRAYRECEKVSGNADMLSATSHWLYMTLRLQGRSDEAREVLKPITAELDIIENDSYHQLLLMYKGERTPEELIRSATAGTGLENATLGYGVGNYLAYNGRQDEADAVLAKVLEGAQWAAFGYIAAEADRAR